MEKLTSKKVLELVKPKLCAKEVIEDVIATYNDEDNPMSIGDIEELTEAWTDMREWKREEKWRLKVEAETYIRVENQYDRTTGKYYVPQDADPVFRDDFAGDCNQDLVNQVYKTGQSPQCWLRVFVPKHECLGNNFRLEVVSTPDDTAIVGWLVIVD